jgi:hypothetical protein
MLYLILGDVRQDRSFLASLTCMSENKPSVYEHWRRKFGFVTGLGLTEDEQQERDLSFKNKKCHEWKRDLLGTSIVLHLIP